MSSILSALVEFIDNNAVGEDEDKELIKVNTRFTPAKYYDADEIKMAVFNYIINKEKIGDCLTDVKNNFQFIKAMNVLYIDADWTFPRKLNESRYEMMTIELMSLVLDKWIDELELNNFDDHDYYYFEFIPNEFPQYKGGFHCYIYINQNITIEQRQEMYNNVKRKITHDENYVKLYEMFQFAPGEDPKEAMISETFYNKLFDKQPLMSCQVLFPYAQKDSGSRKYKLIDKTFDSSRPPDFFVIPIQHKEYMNIHDEQIITNETKVYDDNNDELDEMLNKLKQNNKIEFKILGRVGIMTANFMTSLRYLSKNHTFWKRLADHDQKLKYIIRDVIGFILVNYFIEHRGDAPDNTNGAFYEAITRIMLPLLKMTTINNNEKTERDKFGSLYRNIRDYYSKYTDFAVHDNGKNSLYCVSHQAFWREYLAMSQRERAALAPEDFAKLTRIKYIFQKCYSNWFRFLTETLLAGMTDEIRPFKEVKFEMDDPRDGVVFDEVMKEQPSVNNRARIEDTFYIKTIRLWCRMFIVEEIYNTKSIQEAIRSILTALCRYFIWYSKSQTGNIRLYLYNIRQTKSLCSYPYNQWLLDSKDGDLLKDWIKTIYLTFLKPELLTINLSQGIKPILDNLKVAGIVDNVALERNIKPLNNFDKDMETSYKNIISSFAQEYNNPPKELNPVSAPWFPMRNGLLEFVDDGNVRFHDENYTRFMNVYTNIIYDEKYDYNSDEFKKIQTMWEQIFPIKEERDYCLSIFVFSFWGDVVSCRYQVSPAGLLCHFRPLLPYDFLSG